MYMHVLYVCVFGYTEIHYNYSGCLPHSWLDFEPVPFVVKPSGQALQDVC